MNDSTETPLLLAVNVGNTNIRAAVGREHPEQQTVFFAETDPGDLHNLANGKESVFHTDCLKPETSNGLSPDVFGFKYVKGIYMAGKIEEGFSADIWPRITRSVVASVAPEQAEFVAEAIKMKTGKLPQRVDIHKCGRLDIGDYGGTLGEDRVVCCAYALEKYQPPFIMIDCGTATTINVVNEKGVFTGGAILAGLQTGLDALTRDTAQLPHIHATGLSEQNGCNGHDVEISLIGMNTFENLLFGAVMGMACAIEGYVRRIEEQFGRRLTVIVTGGHAPTVLPHCRIDFFHEPDLMLEGLFAMYR